jgi:chromosomal replication initiation ATPase DnaA
MATITYLIIQKPIEERIIDAACIYWEVDRSYFFQKRGDTNVTYRKGIIYYLIKQNTTYSFAFMAEKFGFLSHQPVLRLVENLESTKKIYKQHFNDINEIQLIADKLDADLIQTEIKLINNKLKIVTG